MHFPEDGTRSPRLSRPLGDYTDRAFAAMLSFCQLDGVKDIGKTVKLIRAQIMTLQEYDWKKPARAMEKVDAGKS